MSESEIVLLSQESNPLNLSDPGLRERLQQLGYVLPDPVAAESVAPAPVLADRSGDLV